MLPDLHDWILRCRRIVDDITRSPYLDAAYELKPEEQWANFWNTKFDDYIEAAEQLLSQRPSDLALRFALLYPLHKTGTLPLPEHDQRKNAFRHLVALCIPEEIADLRTLQFELHNSYLASDWEEPASFRW